MAQRMSWLGDLASMRRFTTDCKSPTALLASASVVHHPFVGSLLRLVSLAFFFDHFFVRLSPRQAAFFRRQLQRLFAIQLRLAHQLFHTLGQSLGQIHAAANRCFAHSNQERNLAFGRPLSQRLLNLGQPPAPKLLMHLRNLPRQTSRPVAQNFPRICDAIRNPMRGFIQNQSSILDSQSLECAPPLPTPLRQKSYEQKLFVRQSRRRQCRQRSRRPRHRHDRNVMPHTQSHQPMPRIRNQRHPRIAHQRNLRALLQRNINSGARVISLCS